MTFSIDMVQTSPSVPDRLLWENIEIFLLILAVACALILNSLVLAQTLSANRGPYSRATLGSSNRNIFAIFKLNLCVSDFLILLVYALGKIVWLITFEWNFGSIGCKFYKFLSSFSFYANSNIIVAIAIDRLKCVYSTQIQGVNSSSRRVRVLLLFCWIIALICSLPQLYLWTTVKPTNSNWRQCVSVFVAMAMEANSTITRHGIQGQAAVYELWHQGAVFWAPLLIILICYFFIVLKMLSFNFRAKNSEEIRRRSTMEEKSSTSIGEYYYPKLSDTWTSFMTINLSARNSHQREALTLQYRNSSSTTWRKQLGSRIFRSACLIVLTHIILWLPYNFISASRFFNEQFYHNVMENGGNVLEDLIIVNSLLNPIIYAEIKHNRRSQRDHR